MATTVSSVLNLYWDLVEFWEDVARAATRTWRPPNSFWTTTGSRCEAGTLASIEVTRAEAQVYVSQQDLLVSQTNLLQQETVLKNAISRNGIANSGLVDAHM